MSHATCVCMYLELRIPTGGVRLVLTAFPGSVVFLRLSLLWVAVRAALAASRVSACLAMTRFSFFCDSFQKFLALDGSFPRWAVGGRPALQPSAAPTPIPAGCAHVSLLPTGVSYSWRWLCSGSAIRSPVPSRQPHSFPRARLREDLPCRSRAAAGGSCGHSVTGSHCSQSRESPSLDILFPTMTQTLSQSKEKS